MDNDKLTSPTYSIRNCPWDTPSKSFKPYPFFPHGNHSNWAYFLFWNCMQKYKVKVNIYIYITVDIKEKPITCWFEQRSPQGQVPRTHSMLRIRFKHSSPHPKPPFEDGLQWQTMTYLTKQIKTLSPTPHFF